MSAQLREFERFSNVFPEPILLVTSTGNLCVANSKAQRELFRAGPFAAGRLLSDFVENEPDSILSYLKSCARSGEPLPSLFKFLSNEGPPLEYRCLGCAFRSSDEQQRPLVVLRLELKELSSSRFIGLNHQIDQLRTEIARRRKVERDLVEQRQLLEVTLSSIGDAVIATDLEGRITFVNPAAEDHLGYASSECVGRSLTDVFVIRNEHTGDAVVNPVELVLKTGRVVGLANHTVLVRRDGVELPIDDSAAPIRDATGNLLGAILVFHEVSESRKLQRELILQADALKEADRRKDQFLAVLAHELRNPLAPMRNGLQIARMKSKSDEALHPVIDMMERQLLHLVRLVDDLMDVSRVSRGVVELRRAPLSISEVIARSTESVRADFESRGHHLQVELPPDAIRVDGDADRLTQVVSNLLTNSAKYSPDGGAIRLSVSCDSDELCIQVSDKGIGIPTDQIDRVFDMFSQVRTHQGRYEGGLGIGLSLVRTLVQLHGGSVTAHSDGPGLGSTFKVRLPVLKASPQASRGSAAKPHNAPALRVLVADDNVDAARTMGLLLELRGQVVSVATSGHDAVRQAAQFLPEVIFMDVGMPDIDGVEATRRIRELPGGSTILIVALTGWGQPQDQERTRIGGMDRHIVKPISPDDIAEVLAIAAQRRDRGG